METIDTRTLIEERDKLKVAKDALAAYESREDNVLTDESCDEADRESARSDTRAALRNFTTEDEDRLVAIDELLADTGPAAADGITLILDTDFTEYAQQLAEDTGAVTSEVSWPYSHIDWSAAAAALRADYTEFEFDGDTYLGRP